MKQEVIRHLGTIESSMSWNHQILGGNTQGCQLVQANTFISQEIIEFASKILFDSYPALRAKLIEHCENLYFSPMEDFSKIVITQSIMTTCLTTNELLEQEVNNYIDPSISMWRISSYVDQQENITYIIASFHHAIVDGSGVIVFLNKLLSLIDKIISGDTVEPATNYQFPPAIDDFLLERKTTIAPINTPTDQINHAISASLKERFTKIDIFSIDKAISQPLIAACKSRKVSTNALFSSILALAFYKSNPKNHLIALKSAVSLRDRTPNADPEMHQLGCYITVANCNFDINSLTLLPELCKKYDSQLFNAMLKTLPFKSVVPSTQLKAATEQVAGQKIFAHGIGITNAGLVETEKYKNFEILDWHTINNRCGGNVAVVLHVIQYNQKINFGFVYSMPLMEAGTIAAIKKDFIALMNDYVGMWQEEQQLESLA